MTRLLAALALVIAVVASSHQTVTQPVSSGPSVFCTMDGVCSDGTLMSEEDPAWDCTTMGNRICGPGVWGR